MPKDDLRSRHLGGNRKPEKNVDAGPAHKPISGTWPNERTIPFLFGAETADVGIDLYTPVTPDYAKGNDKFTGKTNKVTIDLKKLNAQEEEVEKEIEEAEAEDVIEMA